jgi:hypothetical protein
MPRANTKSKNKSSVRTMKDSKRAPAARSRKGATQKAKGNISKRNRESY